jgi:hypothetical protein
VFVHARNHVIERRGFVGSVVEVAHRDVMLGTQTLSDRPGRVEGDDFVVWELFVVGRSGSGAGGEDLRDVFFSPFPHGA